MFKFGIDKPSQLTRQNLESFWGSRKFIAIDLYKETSRLPDSEADFAQERILRRLAVANGTFKFTSSGRFNDFDQVCLKTILESFPPEKGQPLRVHDIGVSDGRTTALFFDNLRSSYASNFDFLATDLSSAFKIVRRKGSSCRLVLDEQDRLIQIITPPFVFNVTQSESTLLYPVNFLLRKLMLRSFAGSLLRAYQAKEKSVTCESLPLICSACMKLTRSGQFSVDRYDIMAGPRPTFEIIRVMNLLNPSYFPDAALSQALRNVRDSLAENGLFLVGSNGERGTIVNGGVYQMRRGELVCLQKSGTGFAANRLLATLSVEVREN